MGLEGFVQFAERIANGPYYYYTGSGRCDPLHSGYADCSGLVVAGLRSQGVGIDCTGSFMLARICHANGTGIPFSQARNTRGALLFMGINEGQGGRPGIDPGHVAIVSRPGVTVEARNRRAGILYGPTDNRGWNYCAMPPWFRNQPGPGPAPAPGPHHRTLKMGDRGIDVALLQQRMRNPFHQNIKVDGVFGPQTQGAVMNVQRAFHLQVDGIAGPKTWAVIDWISAARGVK